MSLSLVGGTVATLMIVWLGFLWWRARMATTLHRQRAEIPTSAALIEPRQPQPLKSTKIGLYRVAGPAGGRERHIGIVTGDIRRVRCADVWVNSENTDMEMARFDEFSISSIIRYEGARRDSAGKVVDDLIADELARKTAGLRPVMAGTVVTTGAGELNRNRVRHVVHVAAVQGEPGAGFRQVREVGRCVTNVLLEVGGLNDLVPVETVLFPLLGVGQGGGQLGPTVEAQVSAAVDYFTMTPETPLTIVYFLAYTDLELETCQAVCGANRMLRKADGGISAWGGKKLQMGFVVDVIKYGSRSAPGQEEIQERLSGLVHRVLPDVGIEFDEVDHQWTGDGVIVFLPSDIDPASVLVRLMRSVVRQLAEDHRLHRDRIRLRMAVGAGLVGVGATGFSGSTVVDINRLVDSLELRKAADKNPGSGLVVLLSDSVHASVIRPGYPGLPAAEFRRVDIEVKEFREPAWLWVAPKQPVRGLVS